MSHHQSGSIFFAPFGTDKGLIKSIAKKLVILGLFYHFLKIDRKYSKWSNSIRMITSNLTRFIQASFNIALKRYKIQTIDGALYRD